MTIATQLKYVCLLSVLISSLAAAHPPERTPGEGAAGLEGIMLGQTTKANLKTCRDSLIEQGTPATSAIHAACYAEILNEIRATLAGCGEGGIIQRRRCDGFKKVIKTIDYPEFTKAIVE
ncbi:hypothetical protein [Motiliproteus sp. SC1-56]|uniref:hypothetical protein n=1 Tax=Motiliproteus sp. SC1-56 TaxID=2799565 RepID=UPI001A8CE904|nr:hypothetical protein [Motiliproteus sp. SC1-56]